MRNLDIAICSGFLILLLYSVWASQVFWDVPRPPSSDIAQVSDFGPPPQFDDIELVSPATPAPRVGTAFSISYRGHWLTAKSNIAGCENLGIEVAAGHYLRADLTITSPKENIAVLESEPISDGLRLAEVGQLDSGMLGFLVGYPKMKAGEIALRLLSPLHRTKAKPAQNLLPVISWAETGRTNGLWGDLKGINGSPLISAQGDVVGVAVGHSRRRGRFYATGLAGIATLLAEAEITPRGEGVPPLGLTDYGDGADALRRTHQIVPVVCLS